MKRTPFLSARVPEKEIFEHNGCLEAWESINNTVALRVWTDASVSAKGAAAAVMIENSQPSGSPTEGTVQQQKGDNRWLQRCLQKADELGLSINILHIDEDYAGRLQGECLLCHKAFDVLIRTFLSRGPTKCDCGEEKMTMEERVRAKAEEFGPLEISNVGTDWTGKVQGRCCLCRKPFDVFIRTFLNRGPTKCCGERKQLEEVTSESRTNRNSQLPWETTEEGKATKPVFPPTTVFSFLVRGNSFRSEGLGLIGAKRLLIERGNLEKKEELHFLCDNKANVELHRRMQQEIERPPNIFIFRENSQLELELMRRWKQVKYIFVKGHIGIPQNEVCDERAKKEVERCRETIAQECLEAFGEIRNGGMRIENRKELGVRRKLMATLATELMKCCKSRMAKRVQLGVERWKGNASIFQETPQTEKCPWCHLLHGLTFSDMVLECPECSAFRKEVKDRWAKVLGKESFNNDLLFGRVRRSLVRQVGLGKDEKKTWKEMTQNLRWWERRLQRLRKELREGSDGDTSETESDEEKKPSAMATLAKTIRVVDEGVVKGGEPDIFFPHNNKEELKKFLRRRKGD